MSTPDPWEPWAKADANALSAVFDLPDFEAQCRALLELAPHASAKQLSLLPWNEARPLREYKIIRERFALERSAKRDRERARDEKPLKEVIQEQLDAAVRTGNAKEANQLVALAGKIAVSSVGAPQGAEDDYSKLTDVEVFALAALCHKLRDEPLTELDTHLLEQIENLNTTPAP